MTETKPRKSTSTLLSITPAAGQRIQEMLTARGKPSAGIRIGTRTKGCNGQAYTLEFADQQQLHDEVVTAHGVTVFIDPKALLFVIGMEMDYVNDPLESGFNFNNPNVKGHCGCGKSFHV